jgi:hypothetical protein
MAEPGVERKYLGRLYEEQFGRPNAAGSAAALLDDDNARGVIEALGSQGLLAPRDGKIVLTTTGIILAEHENLAPFDLVSRNHKVREAILVALADVNAEKGADASASIDDIVKRADIEVKEFDQNIELLMDIKWLQAHGLKHYRLALQGLMVVKGLKLAAEGANRPPAAGAD